RVADADVIGFVNRILANLFREEALRLPPTLRVIDSPELVASALPGGHLVLSSGAIRMARTEADWAGLLAHAIGHIQSRQYGRLGNSPNAMSLIIGVGKWGTCIRSNGRPDAAPMPARLIAQSDLREFQADVLGLGYMANAGYDPEALFSVSERWSSKHRPD